MYLFKILRRENDHWTKKMIYNLKSLDLGWSKNMTDKLQEYNLEQDWEKIKNLTKATWRSTVKTAVQNKNKQKLIDNCKEQGTNTDKIKTKTAYVYEKLMNNTYTFEPLAELLSSNKIETKSIVLSRSGMLMCGKNYKATTPAICNECQESDSEDHRLNYCLKWQDTNFALSNDKVDFLDVFSDNKQVLTPIIQRIQKVWEVKLGNGSMKKPSSNLGPSDA